ncbi:MAG: polysaccharide deacetylase family protein [Cyclobacteriaceae bacterium]
MAYIHKTPTWLKRLYPSLIWDYSDRSDRRIYLTFDDGPIPEVTEFVLETLERYKANATFFCVGDNIVKHPDVANQISDNGHVIGNHTHNHIKGWTTANPAYYQNVAECEAAIESVGISSRRLFRPPYGRIGTRQIRRLKEEYDIVMWDVLSGDYNSSLSHQSILRQITAVTRPGSIVLFHDSIKAFPRMKEVLPAYLKYFTSKGYVFSSL